MTEKQRQYVSYLERNIENSNKSISEANKCKIYREYGRELHLTELEMDEAVAEAELI